ncbi:MAG: hypothetical protein JWQ44_1582 [Chthoniobacter sp.]|jgi:undecaprenyl-diphosphatase|nr:hypothetical protein [Chthoniobacter sp.]
MRSPERGKTIHGFHAPTYLDVKQLLQRLRLIRFPERAILIVLLLIGGSVWAFVEIADEVLEGGSQHFDETAIRFFRDPNNPAIPIGPVWVADVARDVTALGGVTVTAMMTAAVLGFLWLQGRRHAMLLVIVSVVGGAIASGVLKEAFDRERPSLVPHLTRVTSFSFPSGHSLLAAVTYLTLGALLARTTQHRSTKVYFLSIAVCLTLLIGFSRVFLGVHYPTDVLAGWCAGTAWALFCAIIARWLQQRGKVEPASPAPAVKEV